MSPLTSIISDWMIAIVVVIHGSLMTWLFSSAQQKEYATKVISAGKAKLLRWFLWLTPIVSLVIFVSALLLIPWPPSRMGFAVIILSGLLLLLSVISKPLLRSLEFSINAHDDFMSYHEMHFALMEELIENGFSQEERKRVQKKLKEIREAYELKRSAGQNKRMQATPLAL